MLAGREFSLEGERSWIAKGYFGDLENPIITHVNGKGELENPKEYRSTHDIGSDFPDAVTVRLPATENHIELVLSIFPAFTSTFGNGSNTTS